MSPRPTSEDQVQLRPQPPSEIPRCILPSDININTGNILETIEPYTQRASYSQKGKKPPLLDLQNPSSFTEEEPLPE